MSALFKRIGVGIIALDLLVGAGAAAALHSLLPPPRTGR